MHLQAVRAESVFWSEPVERARVKCPIPFEFLSSCFIPDLLLFTLVREDFFPQYI
jgi:hypothetical protein